MSTFKLITTLLVATLLSFSANSEVLYKVTHKDKTLWILGTLHVADSKIDLSNEAKNALEASDEVWLEVSPDEIKQAQQLMMRSAKRTDGSLSDEVKSSDWEQLVPLAGQLGINSDVLDTMNAWFVQMLVVSQAMSQAGYVPQNGVEQEITSLLSQSDKPVKGLETAQRQIDALVSAQKGAGEGELIEQTLNEVELMKARFGEFQQAWIEGDLPAIMDYFTAEMPPEAVNALLIERNKEWMSRLVNDVSGENVLIAVGSAHLGGEQGLLKLLEAEGGEVSKVH